MLGVHAKRAARRVGVLRSQCLAPPVHESNRRVDQVLYTTAPLSAVSTHVVTNQATPLTQYNAFTCDNALMGYVDSFGGGWGKEKLSALGSSVGSSEWQQRSRDANHVPPKLQTHDRFGNRKDAVEFHPAYHQLMGLGLDSGAASFAWQPANRGKAGAHVIRGALMYLMYQLNPGVCCPITMTFAATPALEAGTKNQPSNPFLYQILEKLRMPGYNGSDAPLHHKRSVTLGMSMTEKQGGSDVRANTTYAVPVHPQMHHTGDEFELVGHKWFTSAPMSDGFLTLAQTPEGVSCFLVPRWLPAECEGSDSELISRNEGFQLQRLKDKMGDKSNASSEVEYRQAKGWMIGEPGRGIRTIVDMVVHTRLDCVIGSAALMRQCAQLAAHHCMSRKAFGKRLSDQPLMQSVLADLSIESEAAVALWTRLAAALDNAGNGDISEGNFIRLATAISKYWICKRAPLVAYEAMECHGGNGYVEDGPMASLFRQSPLNAIWEGSGNVICLDVLRAIAKEPESTRALFAELDKSKHMAPSYYSDVVDSLRDTLLGHSASKNSNRQFLEIEHGARALVDKLAVCLQATTLLQYGDPIVANSFLATRLPDPGLHSAGAGMLSSHNLGALPGHFLEPDVLSALISRIQINLDGD